MDAVLGADSEIKHGPASETSVGLSLPVLLLLITLGVEVIGWIGSERLVSFLHPYVTYFSSTPNATAQRSLRKQILAVRSELAGTSSQNEFAKWAKLRRKLDKGVADLEAIQAQNAGAKAQFGKMLKAALFMLTTVMPFIVSSWHRKEAVFYLPHGWFGPLGWFMSLPSAPAGGIACGIWTMACKRTIGTVKDIVVDNFFVSPAEQQRVPVPVPASAGKTGTEPNEKSGVREKDEL